MTELDLYALCTLRIDNEALQCYLFDTVLGNRYRRKRFDDVTQLKVDWKIKKENPSSMAVRMVMFVDALLGFVDDDSTIAVLVRHNTWLQCVHDIILFYITCSVQWWIGSKKIVNQLVELMDEFSELYNKRHYDAKVSLVTYYSEQL